MHWHHSLILRYASKNSHLSEQLHTVFSTYHVSFLTYLVILTPDKTLQIFLLSLTYPFHVHDSKLKLKQESWFYSHLGHCSLEGNLQVPHLASLSGICLLSTFNKLYPFIFNRHYTVAEYAFFVQKVDRWRKDMASLWGNLNICPQLHWLQLPCHMQEELSSLNSLKVWGKAQKPHHDIIFLLVQVENAMGDRHYGISIVWANPSQVRAASMEDVVKKLTACSSSGANCLMP